MSHFHVLPPDIRHVQSAYARRAYSAVTDAQIINAAIYFDNLFRTIDDAGLRSQTAAILIALYRELSRRMRRQPLSQSLPFNNVNGRGAEMVDDIVPFGSLDLWIAALQHSHPARRASRRPGSSTVNMPGETVRGIRPNNEVPSLREPGIVGSMTPVPTDHGSVGDIAGMIDTGNGVLGVAAMLLESFALDVFGTLAGGVISVFGLAATWIDSDRQIARLHAAHELIMSLYDMSGPFRDRELYRRPYAQWPAIREPIEPILTQGNSHEAQIQNAARTEATQRALQYVRNLERRPVNQNVRHAGREYIVPVTGKAYLYYLNIEARKRGVGVSIFLRDVMQQRTGLNLGVFRWN